MSAKRNEHAEDDQGGHRNDERIKSKGSAEKKRQNRWGRNTYQKNVLLLP